VEPATAPQSNGSFAIYGAPRGPNKCDQKIIDANYPSRGAAIPEQTPINRQAAGRPGMPVAPVCQKGATP